MADRSYIRGCDRLLAIIVILRYLIRRHRINRILEIYIHIYISTIVYTLYI